MSELTHINCVALTARFPVGKPVVPAALMNRPTRGREAVCVLALLPLPRFTDSLRSVVRLRRAVSAHQRVIRLSTESGDNAGKNMQNALRPARETSEHDRRRVPRRPRSGATSASTNSKRTPTPTPPPRRADCSSNRSPARRSTRSGTTASPEAAESAIENMVGSIQVPMGVAGPVSASTAAPSPARSTSPRPPRARSSRRSTAVARSSTAPAARPPASSSPG